MLAVALTMPAMVHAGQNYAVVVGVSSYPGLEDRFSLVGPKYDAELVRDFLVEYEPRPFPAEHIELLADGAEGGRNPTRAAVLEALDRTAERAEPGDFVYLHFAGHGTRAPAQDADTEIDGLDELFLPHDASEWNDYIGAVENSLTDDVIGERIAAIRDSGAFVWAVFDSCHAGTATRGTSVGEGVRYRKISPDALGIPDDELAEARAGRATRGSGEQEGSLDRGAEGQSGAGGFVAFYAAQSTEQTLEMKLPRGEPDNKPHGLFTYTLMEVLGQHRGVTYRQASQEILQRYAAERRSITPLFEGDLDARVFGTEPGASVAQWPLEELGSSEFRLRAGTIHGLRKGDELIVVPSPAAESDQQVGAVRVASANAMHSRVEAVDGDVSVWPEAAVARRETAQVRFGLKVARPDFAGVRDDEGAQRVRAALDALDDVEDGTGAGLHVEWVEPGEDADVRLVYPLVDRLGREKRLLDNDHVWLAPPSGEIVMEGPGATPAVSLHTPRRPRSVEELITALNDSLTKMARVTNLLRLGSVYGPASSPLEVELRVKRADTGEFERFTGEEPPPAVFPGDEVHITARNPDKRSDPGPIDINLLFVSSEDAIQHMGNARVHPGSALERGIYRVTDDSLGREHLLLIATPAGKQDELQDLSFLEQEAIQKTRGWGDSAFERVLDDARTGTTTRGAAALGDDDSGRAGSIRSFTVVTQKSDEAESL